jgi:hypothetical protein
MSKSPRANRALLRPGIEYRLYGSFEIRRLPRHQSEVVNLSSRRDERIHRVNGSTTCLAAGDQPPPLIGDGSIDADDSTLEPLRQLIAEPFIKPLTPGIGA